MLRAIAIVKVAQRAGVPLSVIREHLGALRNRGKVTQDDWRRLSTAWRKELDDRIARLTRLRDQFDSCIGCGCLSLADCPLRNPLDELSEEGAGPLLLERDDMAPPKRRARRP